MKLARFRDNRTGLVVGPNEDARILDVRRSLDGLAKIDPRSARILSDLLPTPDAAWMPMIRDWSAAMTALGVLAEVALRPGSGISTELIADVRLGPPLPSPSTRIWALGGNFTSHVERVRAAVGKSHSGGLENVISRKGDGRPPWGFFVIPGTVVGPEEPIVPPRGTRALDYEAEVAVVLASGGRHLDVDDVTFWGATAWNDFSIRDQGLGFKELDRGVLTWSLSKNFDTGNACGPWLVVDKALDLQRLPIACRVNGEVRQSGTSGEMIYEFREVVAFLSSFITLQEGDMFTSGSPAGTAIEDGAEGRYLQPGDVTEVTVDGIGTLRNVIHPAV